MPAPVHKRRLTAFAVAMALLIVTPLAVVAADAFTDVPDTNVHHDDITWLKDAGVTLGCNPPANTQFCPGDPVLRQQMASFMRRLAENQVVDAATALEANHAATADDADTVDGLDSSDLTSGLHIVSDEGFVSVPADATTDVISLELPPGTYLVLGRGGVNSNMATPGRRIECTLSAGSVSQTLDNFFLNTNLDPGETEEASFILATSLEATGDATLSCTTQVGWAGNILDPTITAISVQDLSIATLDLAGEQGDQNG